MNQEHYDKLQSNPNGKIFRKVIKKVNYITPIILDYVKCGKHIAEISKTIDNPDIDTMYGVTVITEIKNGYKKDDKLCKALYDYNEVEQYLKELENE